MPRADEQNATTATQAALPGSLATLATSWKLSLRAANRAPKTIDTYLSSVRQLIDFLEQAGKPTTAAGVAREHVEAFLADLLETRSAATASVRYRALKVYFSWLEAEGEIRSSPMERIPPPHVPDRPVPVLTEAQLRAVLATAEGPTFTERRDSALWMLVDTGVRRAELADLKVSDVALEDEVALVVGKGRRPCVPFGAKTARAVDRYLRARPAPPPRLGLAVAGPQGTVHRHRGAPDGQAAGQPGGHRRPARPHVQTLPCPSVAGRGRQRGRVDEVDRVEVPVHGRPPRPPRPTKEPGMLTAASDPGTGCETARHGGGALRRAAQGPPVQRSRR